MTLRDDINKAKELDAKATPTWETTVYEYDRVQSDLLAHYRNLVPRLIEQIERMEGALHEICNQLDGLYPHTNAALNAARSALAALDKE
jgi:hypothetical protein